LKVTTSNADLGLTGSGTGSVVINNVNLDAGTIDNTVIGANEPAAGNFTQPIGYSTLVIPNKITFSGNTMSTNRSNDNLEFAANGSGKVVINGLSLPNSDGQTGEFIQTDGSGNLTFAGVSISFSESTIQDARATIGFTSEVVIDANLSTGENESITADTSMINDWASSKYDSAFYVTLSRVEEADSSIEFQMQKHILARGTNDGSTFDSFSGSAQIIRTSAAEEVQLSTDIRAATDRVRLLGTGGKLADGSTTSAINTLHFFRIGLGDNDSSGTQAGSSTYTQQQTLVVADLDSAAATLDSWSASSYRGAKYFISVNNTTSNEVSSSEVLLVHDGTDAFVSEYNLIISNAETTPLATFTADISGGNVRLRGANGTAGTCRITMYRILLSDSEVDRSGTPIAIVGSTPIGQITTTDVDHVTTTIDSRQGFESEETLDEFASSKYDSAWYHTLVKDMTSGRLAFHKYSLLHGTSNDSSIEAFVTDSSVVRSEEFDVVTANASVDDGNIRLNLTGINDGSTTISNFVNSFRLGLGDSDSTGYVGEESSLATVEINTDVDSASESIDSFAHSDHRGAKYYVSVKNASGGEVMNIELLVVHNGTDAFITSYNEHSSGNTGAASTNTLCTFTAAIDGSNVVVSAAGLQTNLRIHMYRILLADDQSASTGTNVNVINAKTISSSATLIDSFNTSTYGAAHYIIIATKSNDSCIMEATVISDGTNASISEGPQVSTEETPMLDLTVNQVSATAVVQASATSGGSTTVNAYRIHIPVPAGTQYTEIDSFAHNSTQGAMYIAVTNQTDGKSAIDEFMVVTDGTDAYNLRYGINTDSASSDLVNWTTAVEGSNAKVRASLADSRAQGTINAWQVHLDRAGGNPSNIATLDSFNKTTHRGAFYTVSISDSNGGTLGNYELVDVRVTHDGTTPFISVFGRTNSASDDLVTFSADIDGDNVRLRGQINTSNTHTLTAVRRLLEV
jgi:ribosomal protein S16